MARDPQSALIALNRFGFGARGGAAGDLINAASDPRGFVRADVERPERVLLDLPNLQSTPDLVSQLFAYQGEIKRAREAKAKQIASAGPGMAPAREATKPPPRMAMATDGANATARPQVSEPPNVIQTTFRAESLARVQRAVMVDCGFSERLVAFWSNHFCISASKGGITRILAGAFEREAIRPHVYGRFSDMLLAVERHPAMLVFLDNQQSIGPNSRAGLNRHRGLNENLARETMELHTLGVDGGYTQADVTSLARILTGWTFAGRGGRLGPPGTPAFNPNAHEPGPQTLLGKVYPDTGPAQAQAALSDIARHSATAKFIATKFARHFVADDPPPALVARLQENFTKTGGDLRAMSLALIDSDEAWRAPLSKMRLPYEYLVATGRALGRIPDNPGLYLGGLSTLGQPLWTPPGPNGFPDTSAAWAEPEQMKLRLDIASRVSSRIADTIDPRELLDVVAGEAASSETRQAVARAETRQQALALLLMSPEFQRR